jgi:ATP-binding cassette subfamily F protein uup
MATLISCQELTKSYHGKPLFEGLSFSVGDRDRLGILGPNGAGKSTLLRLMLGVEEADAGLVVTKQKLRVGYVPQVASFPQDATALSLVAKAGREVPFSGDDTDQALYKAHRTLTQLGFGAEEAKPESLVSQLSGGWLKRLSLAQAIVCEPDVLLLDEPTNHLDLEGIFWLEEYLRAAPFAWVMISHDRTFLERTVTRIIEISRIYPQGIFESVGRYSDFIQKRSDFIRNQQATLASLDNKVRREVEWLRRGPQARTTKAKGRIDEAHALIEELSTIKGRNQVAERGSSNLDFSATGRKSKRLIVAEGLSVQVGDRVLLKGLDLVLTPGIRVGLMGGNGTGKTTLLKVFAGEIAPSFGTLTQAEGLKVVYFDQKRDQLDPGLPLRRVLCPSGDAVIFRGQSIHIASWARRFQFGVSQLDVPVGELSGGEQARALIAKLMLEPADVLLLDEPTNDLDIPTLEALEESLGDFPGALVLVSHDRYLVDSVCNVIAGLDGYGGLKLFADLEQWEKDLKAATRARSRRDEPASTPSETPSKERSSRSSKRLSYMEQREFDRIESDIQTAELDLAAKEAAVQDPALSINASRLAEAYADLEDVQAKIEKLYARWAELEAKLSSD